jgi:TusA-related sulfurtransferase
LISERAASTWQADDFFDADDRGCTSGVLDAIADCMLCLAPNQTLEIRAIDPCMTANLTAWCRLTGYALTGHARG